MPPSLDSFVRILLVPLRMLVSSKAMVASARGTADGFARYGECACSHRVFRSQADYFQYRADFAFVVSMPSSDVVGAVPVFYRLLFVLTVVVLFSQLNAKFFIVAAGSPSMCHSKNTVAKTCEHNQRSGYRMLIGNNGARGLLHLRFYYILNDFQSRIC